MTVMLYDFPGHTGCLQHLTFCLRVLTLGNARMQRLLLMTLRSSRGNIAQLSWLQGETATGRELSGLLSAIVVNQASTKHVTKEA